jgi:hypothetical protein
MPADQQRHDGAVRLPAELDGLAEKLERDAPQLPSESHRPPKSIGQDRADARAPRCRPRCGGAGCERTSLQERTHQGGNGSTLSSNTDGRAMSIVCRLDTRRSRAIRRSPDLARSLEPRARRSASPSPFLVRALREPPGAVILVA